MTESMKYTGILAEPLDMVSYDAELIKRKVAALYDHYGIETKGTSYTAAELYNLVLHLAKHHVPGFQPPQKTTVGRPGKYTGQMGNQLVADVIARTVNGTSVLDACKQLCMNYPYQGVNPKSLQIRYFEAMKRVFKELSHIQVIQLASEINRAIEEDPELRRDLEDFITETKPSLSV